MAAGSMGGTEDDGCENAPLLATSTRVGPWELPPHTIRSGKSPVSAVLVQLTILAAGSPAVSGLPGWLNP